MIRPAAIALSLAFAAPPAFAADPFVTITATQEEFTAAFCATDRSTQRIFVLPMALFHAGGGISCGHGISRLRIAEPSEDPGHAIVNIDPPTGVADGLDCDGKVDLGMSLVAINCLPQDFEAADHTKS